jgi:AcrR family transcriptional regulator
MPRTPQQYEEIREEKRNLIMDVALEHFANKGFHSTPISHIAKHAGISKGLMYNYFSSKEELLKELIRRSVAGILLYFDPDRDGRLTKDEFELFIRKLTLILREKRSVWRLFFQMMMQEDVREQIDVNTGRSEQPSGTRKMIGDNDFIPGISAMLQEYFRRDSARKPKGYDPEVEYEMFLVTLKGIAVTYIFMENDDDGIKFNKTIERFIQLYK